MTKRRVLVVEDDDDLRRSLVRCLVREGCQVVEAHDGQDGVERLQGGVDVELVITDLQMPRLSGREVLQAAARRRLPVVILTGHATVTTAVELMRQGAANFLTKPFSPATIRAVLDDTFGRSDGAPPRMIAQDEGFKRVLDVVKSVAETDVSVLITGESGTGKELVARAIHEGSPRAGKPFIAVNCGAIPEALLESELFGHARGAFTGATHSRAGRFQLADGGTLFLDEIGDMPLAFQVKLLRVLQERQFEVLGEGTTRTVDVRVIAATHRDLRRLAAEGKFRDDLYFRLNVIELELPPLRERRGDIPPLVSHFIDAANARHARQVTGASEATMAALCAYRWPGNVRELANVVERMVVLRRSGELQPEDLPSQLRGGTAAVQPTAELPPAGLDLRAAIEHLEDSLIAQALRRTGGNRKAAAELLGLNRTTLVEKLKRKGYPAAE